MAFNSQELSLTNETAFIFRRARVYITVRAIVDAVLLALMLLQPADVSRNSAIVAVLGADLALLALYWASVKRWPTASTYLQMMSATLLLIAFDFAWGSITVVPWFLTILLSIAGGLIVTRAGFNGLVTFSIFAVFVVYLGLIDTGRIPLPLAIPQNLAFIIAAALAVTLLIINAMVEAMVVYFYETEGLLLQTRAQLLYSLQELEQSRNLLYQVQDQARRTERLSIVGQIAEQLSRSLREPLTAIEHLLGNRDELMQNPQAVSQLHTQVLAALRMIEGLKEYASLGSLHIKAVNLDDMLAQELSHTPIPASIKLSIQQPPVFPPIQADPDKVRLVVHHLLHNALQAVADGGEIHIELMSRPDGVALSISDTGPGVPPDEAPFIFEPLYTTQAHGFGLGLAIARQVVAMHGGYIEVESEPGQGAKFTLFLPRVPQSKSDNAAFVGDV